MADPTLAARLQAQGVTVLAPETLYVAPEVPLEAIQGPGTVLHPGTRLRGARLLIQPGAELGAEAPATVEDCAVGPGVKLHGGFFSGAVFFDGAEVGSSAHVRPGTLLEEGARAAHAVGLKETILLPFVTLGSLINFCDILMAGGTSAKDHSEVGSSFIHFNFTPRGRRGDKATASLVGDVPRGVMLRSRRIFLGGQGGLVGPTAIDYGTVLAAGGVYRRPYGPDLLVTGEDLDARSLPFDPLRYPRIAPKVALCLRYLGNLMALWHWSAQVRDRLAGGDPQRAALYLRGREAIAACVKTRIAKLGDLAASMDDSIAALGDDPATAPERDRQRRFADAWPQMNDALARWREHGALDHPGLSALTAALDALPTAPYTDAIQRLDDEAAAAGTTWLQHIVERAEALAPW